MKKVGSGGYSTVWRPMSLTEGATPHVIKEPNKNITAKQRAQVVGKYRHQKKLLDQLHQKVPRTASPLFNRIRQIRPDGSVVMNDLGDKNLAHVLRNNYFSLFADIANVWSQLKIGVLSMLLSGVAHRDIKDGNIMAWRTPTGKFRVVFIDFSDSITKQEVEKLETFVNFGTKECMSPELLDRRCHRNTEAGSWDEYVANDLWALGILFYRILYNKHPIDMFRQLDPYMWDVFTSDPKCQSKDKTVKLLLAFYNDMREYPNTYNSLFRPVAGKEKFVNEVKTLLSLDPQRRLAWLNGMTRPFRQWQAASGTLRQQSQKKQQQQPTPKRARVQSGVQMLLRAASALQEKKNKTPQK